MKITLDEREEEQGKENDETSRQVEQRRTNEKEGIQTKIERACRLISKLIEEIKAFIYVTKAERIFEKLIIHIKITTKILQMLQK